MKKPTATVTVADMSATVTTRVTKATAAVTDMSATVTTRVTTATVTPYTVKEYQQKKAAEAAALAAADSAEQA